MQLDDRSAVHDANLLEGAAMGDRDAFAALYDRLSPLVYGLILRVVRDRAIAEEVTQEVFLALWSTAGAFDPSRGSVRGWVLTIAHRRAVDVVRREQAARERTTREGATSFGRPFDEVEEAVLALADDAEVVGALRSLTDLQRRAVELAYYQGLTHREVAQVLGVPLGTAKTRIRDGLQRLSTALSVAAPTDVAISA